tara:strand:- start:29 stop:1180 length:1152 start_codon:yes stop_codon:yes gene_type:complete
MDCDDDFENRLKNNNIYTRGKVSNDQCIFNCNGKLYNDNYLLNGKNVELYEYSPTDENFSTIYKCKTPIKYMLRAHGHILENLPKVQLTDNQNKFTLFTYTNPGHCLDASKNLNIGCDDDNLKKPISSYSQIFFEIAFSDERVVKDLTGEMAIVECSGDLNFLKNKPILTLIDGYITNQRNYRNNINFYSLSVHDPKYGDNDVFTKFRLERDFNLSDLVPALKKEHPGREIHLHLVTCLTTNNYNPIKRPDKEIPLTSEWIEHQTNPCGDIPTCTLDIDKDSIDMTSCPIGRPKRIKYNDIHTNSDNKIRYQPSVIDEDRCIIKCADGYAEIGQSIKDGKCLTYKEVGGIKNTTEFLNKDNNILKKLSLRCIPKSKKFCAARM